MKFLKGSPSSNAQDAIVVLTSAAIKEILADGGSKSWVLNPNRAKDAAYLVCCRNEKWSNRQDGAPQRAAFLVGRISGLEQVSVDGVDRSQRFLIKLSHYARVAINDAWDKTSRNPVAYRTLKDVGIALEKLKFEPLAVASSDRSDQGMTIADAKKALAATYGVSPDNIEIIIRG